MPVRDFTVMGALYMHSLHVPDHELQALLVWPVAL